MMIARGLAALAIFIFGWWVVAGFRTQTIGTEYLGTHVLTGIIFVLPLTLIPFVGFKGVSVVKGSLSLFAMILFVALLWASLEEYVVMQATPQDKQVHIRRWWPFENHELYYSPETGWQAND
ncbi:MAG: hypothetical protein H6673_03570 [Anaerolineales bacterium]|nr:hypothetical protein [Anaerolineales bacterium]